MRIDELTLLAYGKFTDHSLAFPKSAHDIHFIIGPNEAGKSTVRRAVTELLFGMERQSPLGFKHPQSDLRISGVLNAGTTKLAFIRTKQQKSLRSMTEEILPATYLDTALGSLTQEAFEQLHCLDHERLLKGGQGIVDPRNSVSQILFQAASGVEGFSTIREALAGRAGELFSSRSRNNDYAKAADRLFIAQKTLKSVQVRTREWVAARDAFQDADDDLEAERKNRQEFEALRASWERARRLAPLVERLVRLQREFADLGNVLPFPPNAKATLEAGIFAMDAAGAKVKTREDDVVERQQKVDDIVVDENVLVRTPEIERLARLCGLFGNHRRDLPLRRSEVNAWLEEVLIRSAEFGWGSTEEDVRSRLPQEKTLRTIGAMLKERGVLLAEERAAKEVADERQTAVIDLQKRFDNSPEQVVEPQLVHALTQALPYQGSDAKQKQQFGAMNLAEASLKRTLAALNRPDLAEEALWSMQLPSLERVAALRVSRQEIVQAINLARSLAEQSNASAVNHELQISQYERSHKVVTVSEVSEARRSRDGNWGAIKAGLLLLEDGAPQLDVAIRLADELVDARIISEADGAGLEALRDQFETAKNAQSYQERIVEDKALALDRVDANWAEAATKMGIQGMEIDDLPDWLSKRDGAMQAAATFTEKKHEYQQERDRANEARRDLLEALAKADIGVQESSGLSVLCIVADEHIKNVDRGRMNRQALEQQLQTAQMADKAAQKTSGSKAKAVENWVLKWNVVLTSGHLSGIGDDVAEVEAAVLAAGFIRQRLERIDAHRSERIEAMEADLDELAEVATELSLALAPELSQSTPDELLRVLNARLEDAKRQSNRKTQAQEFLDGAKRHLDEERSALTQAKRGLEPLLKVAGVESALLALPLVQRAERKSELENAISETNSELEKGSDGLTLTQIQEEVSNHPATEASARLMSLKDSLDDSDRKLATLLTNLLTARQEFDAINGGDQAALAEAQKQESLAEMSDIGEEYLQLAVASTLLKWAVDKYRDRKQGPLLQRASAAFKSVTRGSFEKLRVDYDQTPPALLAYRPNNQAVKVSGLSDGTRDQLFLALRIAALELQTEQGIPVPFIADDLFINFDDRRSQAGLWALHALSAKTQVLFLTHHEHLLPVVRQLFPQANVIALQTEEAFV